VNSEQRRTICQNDNSTLVRIAGTK
jgi:hypothetical protein